MKDDRVYLEHILESIHLIQEWTVTGRDSLSGDARTQAAVLRRLQTLAESTQRVSDALKSRHPEIDWRAIAGFRNVVVHDYLGIDLDLVWRIVERNLPELGQCVESMLQEIQPDSAQ
ncbi:MAG: DUF86 domain-containing protein [Chloroflexi bacterium]|nr:DUF86 domain-containing protein [Chloroflexota bacterium]